MKTRTLPTQQQLDIFEDADKLAYNPHDCPNCGAVLDTAKGGKSFCIPWDCWTNCREAGHCIYVERHRFSN